MLRRPLFSAMSDEARLQFQKSMIVNFLIRPVVSTLYVLGEYNQE